MIQGGSVDLKVFHFIQCTLIIIRTQLTGEMRLLFMWSNHQHLFTGFGSNQYFPTLLVFFSIVITCMLKSLCLYVHVYSIAG